MELDTGQFERHASPRGSYSPLAKTLLARRRKDFATGLTRPHLSIDGPQTPHGELDLSIR
jgi:hypothetical protein